MSVTEAIFLVCLIVLILVVVGVCLIIELVERGE